MDDVRQQRSTAPAEHAPSVVDHVAEAIRQRVLDGRYVPGQRLVEADMTAEFGVSRGPLREALRRLAVTGVVEIQPHRGAVVRRPSRDELMEMFRVREVMEGLAARLAAERIDLPGNRAIVDELMRSLLEPKPLFDVMDYVEDNEAFHGAIMKLGGSQLLERFVSQLQMPTHRMAFFRLFKTTNRHRSIEQHTAILRSIAAGDSQEAERAMREHVSDTEALSHAMSDTLFQRGE